MGVMGVWLSILAFFLPVPFVGPPNGISEIVSRWAKERNGQACQDCLKRDSAEKPHFAKIWEIEND